MAKVDEEALGAIKEIVDAGFQFSISAYSSGYEATIFARKMHSHFQDVSFSGAVFKARKAIDNKGVYFDERNV